MFDFGATADIVPAFYFCKFIAPQEPMIGPSRRKIKVDDACSLGLRGHNHLALLAWLPTVCTGAIIQPVNQSVAPRLPLN